MIIRSPKMIKVIIVARTSIFARGMIALARSRIQGRLFGRLQ